MTLSSRIGVMTDGEIFQVGTPHEIHEHPQTRFVADFIVSVNMFEGRITEDHVDHVIIRSPDARTDIFVPHGISCVAGQKAAVAVRPEKVQISKTQLRELRNSMTGKIDKAAYLGNSSVFHVVLDSGKHVRVCQSNLTRYAENTLTCYVRVYVGWDDDAGIVVSP